MTHDESLQQLLDGNKRYLQGNTHQGSGIDAERRALTAKGQSPFAAILTCADSRVPPELLFDQGLGDIFTIRVAGNVVTPTQLGSLEFAAAALGTRLIMILGHSGCGALRATLGHLQQPDEAVSPNLARIVQEISPRAQALLDEGLSIDDAMPKLLRANVQFSVSAALERSEILRDLAATDGLKIVGAEVDLKTGVVDLIDA